MPLLDATGENVKKSKRYTQEQAIAGEATFAKHYAVAIEHAT